MTIKVEIFSRSGCHLCEVAEKVVREVHREVPFDLHVILIDGDKELENEYGEEVPITIINGQRHDYFKVDRARFKDAILRLHQ